MRAVPHSPLQELREKLTELAFQAPDAPAWMETMRHVNQDQDMPLQRGIPEVHCH